MVGGFGRVRVLQQMLTPVDGPMRAVVRVRLPLGTGPGWPQFCGKSNESRVERYSFGWVADGHWPRTQ